ncbi:grass carp reovirus (GCRV)-induced gene 2q [Danio aesculapii]|uniref:grass carp reovirus (GCRV)-induced gene 2q n=1 Tax=Danio aesculapii TaxID=1142201 RepID=UPI0024C029D5|nr:grass carp reovirus (GCRV)-induced gene 2q [Danio aesculapii]
MVDNGYDTGIQKHPGRRSYIMYHGTTMAKALQIQRQGFMRSADGMLGPGVYVSRSKEKASRYPIQETTKRQLTGEHCSLAILKLRVRVGKVKRIDCQGHPLQKTWHQHGYDTAWVPANCGMVDSGLEEDCVYDPSRIKVLEIIPKSPFQETTPGTSSRASITVNAMGNKGSKNEDNNQSGQKTYIMYHGTTMANAVLIQFRGFQPSSNGMLGPGVYVSRSRQKAARYPLCNRGQPLAILKLSVRVGKVKKIDRQGHPLQKSWHQHGYDTAWVPPNCGMVPSGLEEDCVYDPSRIKVLEIIPN